MTVSVGDGVELCSTRRAWANTFLFFVGAGILGLPYAFRKTGMAGSGVVLVAVGMVSAYSMHLLVQCKRAINGGKASCRAAVTAAVAYERVDSQDSEAADGNVASSSNGKSLKSEIVGSYGGVGAFVYGEACQKLVDSSLLITQAGFCCAYLIFIGTNLHSIIPWIPDYVFIIACIFPLSVMVRIRQLKTLALFSMFANFANLFGIFAVFWRDFSVWGEKREEVEFGVEKGNLPFFFGVAIYCFEGMGTVIPIERSMEHKNDFTQLLLSVVALVTLLYFLFGYCGYYAFGMDTREIITLNLGGSDGSNFAAALVKSSLCTGLFFTYPMMMFPVFEVVEKSDFVRKRSADFASWVRMAIAACTGIVSIAVPNFGLFISFLGASCCSLLAFILPPMFHNKVCSPPLVMKCINYVIIVIGIIGAVLGTTDSARELLQHYHHEAHTLKHHLPAFGEYENTTLGSL